MGRSGGARPRSARDGATPGLGGALHARADGLDWAADWLTFAAGGVRVAEVRGPARLAYVDETTFRPPARGPRIDHVDGDGTEARRFLASVPVADAEEAGIASCTSPWFCIADGDDLVAAAGYRVWSGELAHLSVLVAPEARGRGRGRAVAGAATEHALANGLLGQWRARAGGLAGRRGRARLRAAWAGRCRSASRSEGRGVVSLSQAGSMLSSWRIGESLTIDCGDCVMAGTSACDDCIVSFIVEPRARRRGGGRRRRGTGAAVAQRGRPRAAARATRRSPAERRSVSGRLWRS